MPSIGSAIGRFQADVGELLEVHAERAGVDLTPYRPRTPERVAAFAREVLRFEGTAQQRQLWGLYCANRYSAIRSAVGVGKTAAGAVLVLYHLYVERGQVVTLSMSDRQVRELMWGQIRMLWARAALPGEMFTQALRVDAGTGQTALGFVTSDENMFRGWHHPRLLVVVDEAQGVPAWVWTGLAALATGDENKVVAIGNPGPPVGPWYNLFQNPGWAHLALSALDHVNIREGREVVPGGPSRAWLEHLKREYGEGSPYFRAMVLGEFSEQVGESLIERGWIDAAVARWRSGEMEPEAARGEYVASLDVARYGPDSNVLMLRRGPVVKEIATWQRCDLMETVDRVVRTLGTWRVQIWPDDPNARNGFPSGDPLIARFGRLPRAELTIDTIGLGAGVYDACNWRGYAVREFVASHSAMPQEAHKFMNKRAEAAFGLMRCFQDGRIAIPPSERLIEELLAVTWFQNPSGRIQLEAKEETRLLLGRSPDLFDSLVMVCLDLAAPRGVRFESVRVPMG